MQTWIDIITDPHHLFADFIMNFGYEIIFSLITYKLIVYRLQARAKKK